jgi:uncharacterized protein YdhG (YjbR/CyaY superfamily)
MPSPDKIRFASHDQYFAAQAPAVQAILTEIQRRVETQVAESVRCIGYNMPAFRRGKIFFYFAAFKKHIGIYPPVTADQALIANLAPFRGPKGNLSFRLDQPIPYELIARVAEALSVQYRSDGSPPPRST